MNTAVVTGASGHIGYHVARVLLDRGISTKLVIRRANENVADLASRGASVQIVDFRNQASLISAFQGCDVLFHLAAENTTETGNSESVLDSTIRLVRDVCAAAIDAKIPTIVYTSSVVVLGRSPDPTRLITENDRARSAESPYVEGKIEAEQFCDELVERDVDIRRAYPSWVLGPGDLRGTPPQHLVNRILRKGQAFWFRGGISIASVEEVAKAHVAIWQKGERKSRYVLGGANITFREFFALIAMSAHTRAPKLFAAKPALVLGASVVKVMASTLGKVPPLDPAYIKNVVGKYSWYDSSRAERDLGYKIPDPRALLAQAVRQERMRFAQTLRLGLGAPVAHLREDKPALLVTGTPGWLGNRLIEALVHGIGGFAPADRRVHLLVQPHLAGLFDLPDHFRIFPGDLADREAIKRSLRGVGTVFHLAGAIYPPKIATLYEVNVQGTRNLVDASIASGARRFLFMSTDSVCGHGTPSHRVFDDRTPPNPYRHYGNSKWLAEQYILEKTKAGLLDGTILRGFWFFGPYAPQRQKNFLDMMSWRRQIVFGNGKNFRSVSHVDNLVTAMLQAENAPESNGKCYWINDGVMYTVDQIYQAMCRERGNTYNPFYVSSAACALARMLDAALGKVGRLHPTVHAIGKFDFDIAGSIDAAVRDFGYKPLTILDSTPGRSPVAASGRTDIGRDAACKQT